MSSEGVTLVARAALVLLLILAAAFFRTLVGPGLKRRRVMLVGTLAGVSVGAWIGYLVSPWFRFDASSLCASIGVVLGWGVSWLFARRISSVRTDGEVDR